MCISWAHAKPRRKGKHKSQNFNSAFFFSLFHRVLIMYFMVQILSGLEKEPQMEKLPMLSVAAPPSQSLRITYPVVHHDSSGERNCFSLTLQWDLHRGCKCPSVELKPKDSIIPLWPSEIFFKYSLTPFHPQHNCQFLTARVHCLDISIAQARMGRPAVLRHAAQLHANVTAPLRTLMSLGMFTSPPICAVQTLTQREVLV